MDILAGLFTWNIPLLLVLASLSLLYGLLFTILKATLPQLWFFLGSLSLLYLLMGSPLATLVHLTFTTHMGQMGLLFFVFPPLLLKGMPIGCLEYIEARKAAWSLTKLPLAALILFSLLFLLYHLPVILPVLLNQPSLHTLYIVLLLFMALLMWIPLVFPPDCDVVPRKKYARLSGFLLLPACGLFVVSGLMGWMDQAQFLPANLCLTPEGLNSLLPWKINPRADQVSGGLLMMGLHKLSVHGILQNHDKEARQKRQHSA